jgi:hypothetical protein
MRPRGRALSVALTLALPASAQLRAGSHTRCVVAAHALVAADDALDPLAPPSVVPLDEAVAVAWRDRAGALRLQRYSLDLRPLDEAVVIGQPVRAFAMTRAPSGLVLAYIEGDHDVVVARRSVTLEAQNVPRVVAAVTAPTVAIAIAPVLGGALLAWASTDAVRVLPLDGRGVPRGASRVALDQPGSRALRLRPGDPILLRVDATDQGVEPWVLTLQPDGTVDTRARWPVGALGPVRVGGVALTAQTNPLGSPMLLRSSALVAPAALADPALAPRARLDALAVDRELVLALVSDSAGGRQSLVRLLPDGSASWLTVVRGAVPGAATFAAIAPGTVLLVTRDATHSPARTSLYRYACALP